MTAKLAYLDVCALSRPFDNQSYLRVRLETDAVNLILSKIKEGKYKLMFSPVHEREIAAISDLHERSELQAVMKKYGMEALLHALGPIEAIRFITMSKEKRVESVRRHREWQKSVDKERFFDEVFSG